MRTNQARLLVDFLFAIPEIIPQYWNTFEPVNLPLDSGSKSRIVENLNAENADSARASVLFGRRRKQRFSGDITLFRAPEHNKVYVGVDVPWPSGGSSLCKFIENYVSSTKADYAFVADPDEVDLKRFEELIAPYTREEIRLGVRRGRPFYSERRRKDGVLQTWFYPTLEKMFGPNGYLWDIVWYNYFGPPYIELIGKQRLLNAGWARVNELAGGYACFVTETIDDPALREKRGLIRDALQEFVWTPGCKREEKRAPVFDFSEQLNYRNLAGDDADKLIIFAGLSIEDRENAIKALEAETGKQFDRDTNTLKSRRSKS